VEPRYNSPAATITPDRAGAYAALVRTRKDCRARSVLVNPAACDGGIHDSEQIGPWSLWQGNLNADLVIVGPSNSLSWQVFAVLAYCMNSRAC
jgi:hypothetical protein